jgi:hypothetical protein
MPISPGAAPFLLFGIPSFFLFFYFFIFFIFFSPSFALIYIPGIRVGQKGAALEPGRTFLGRVMRQSTEPGDLLQGARS